MFTTRIVSIFSLAGLSLLASHSIAMAAQQIQIDPPPQGEYVLDFADMISLEDEAQINELADKLLKENAIPIIVVTVENMAQYGGSGLRIETFATLLYNQWGIGQERLQGETWNKGILLVVSQGDRFARIELGAGWDREHSELSQEVMDEQIIPRFKNGDYSEGVLRGVIALERMARGEELPRGPIPWGSILLIVGFVGLVVFTIVSLIRRGASGWAWLFWAAVFGILGYMLYSSMRSTGGSGFSGGSFGGGFSGGGGATGSW